MSSSQNSEASQEYYDVIIIGAGLSGISAAYHLKQNCPGKTFALLERRENIGGTWDLFRYPGVRSDSDMFTLGYAFKPWNTEKSIAPGDTIRNYVQTTAQENNLEEHIQFQQKLISSSWSSKTATWTLEVEQADGTIVQKHTNFVMMCSGYYNYDQAYTPEFEGKENFGGQIVHPQFWPDNLDYSNKKVVVIGSGATAITLVPAMAEKAKHITMLQRSPTYLISLPDEDIVANILAKILPKKVAYAMTRTNKVIISTLFFKLSRSYPNFIKKLLLKQVDYQLKDKSLVEKHFTPKYNPWDERLCVVTNGNLFKGINNKEISIVTDSIDRFTEAGIKLQSGETIDADIIITATGLVLHDPQTVPMSVDGHAIDFPNHFLYKGIMLSDVPNMSYTTGYTNASWTLKADLIHSYVCRLLNYMQAENKQYCIPELIDKNMKAESVHDFSSGYVQRSLHLLPKQSDSKPWKLYQNYFLDYVSLKMGSLEDKFIKFKRSEES